MHRSAAKGTFTAGKPNGRASGCAKPATTKTAKPTAKKTAKADALQTAPAQPEKKLSLLSAALEVLKSDDAALTTKQMVELTKARNLWTPGAGKTPEQTLYSAIMREIKAKGEQARFVKDARGHFKARA